MNKTDRQLGPSPAGVVRRELIRAVGGAIAFPFRFLAFIVRRPSIMRAVLADLGQRREPEEAGPISLAREPLRLFVSCAEASGEAHAVKLVEEIRSEARRLGAPEPEFAGLGGSRLAAAGVRIVGDPVSRAAMGMDAFRSISFFRGLLEDAAEFLRSERPDCVVPIDSPALHVPLGHISKRYGVPVVHYVTPQYWAWAPWRVGGYRAAVDLALTILPFEPSWFARHGVRTAHVGHPQQDVLADVPSHPDGERCTLVLLPGSRRAVIRRNLPWMLDVAGTMRATLPDLDVVLPHSRPELHEELLAIVADSPHASSVRIVTGDLHAELARARVALSVSGTVLLDLLHHRVPTVVVYRLKKGLGPGFRRVFLSVPWFSSVNLLAGREVLPEFAFSTDEPTAEVAAHLVRFHSSPDDRARIRAELDETAARLGPRGATRRAAGHILAMASNGANARSARPEA